MLANPIWHALRTHHRCFSVSSGRAARYDNEIGPLSAVEEPSLSAFVDLASLTPENDAVALFLEGQPALPPDWKILHEDLLVQMVLDDASEQGLEEAGSYAPAPLAVSDLPEILALTSLTEPGPFRKRTIELGSYYGIRQNGQLVAMAGERMQMPGFTEISAVCTHPDHRGRGYARLLVSMLAQRLAKPGDPAFPACACGKCASYPALSEAGVQHQQRVAFSGCPAASSDRSALTFLGLAQN